MTRVLKKRYPISVLDRNGKQKIFQHYYELYNDLTGIKYESSDDIAYLDNLVFYGGKTNGDIFGIFENEDYSSLPVKDRVVVDIGANIGDSAIYFASHGARLVLAIEPNELCYDFAKKNIEVNGFSDIIKLIRAGCVSHDSSTRHDLSVKIITLEDIIKNYQLENAILKMDCEGCEYELILNTSCADLRKFSHLKLEYHYGYRNLSSKLTNCGFSVYATSPTYFRPTLNINAVSSHFTGEHWNRLHSVYVGWLDGIKT